jgi:hypothetical protein
MHDVSRLEALIRIDCIYLTINDISKGTIFRHHRKRTEAKHFSLTEIQLQVM